MAGLGQDLVFSETTGLVDLSGCSPMSHHDKRQPVPGPVGCAAGALADFPVSCVSLDASEQGTAGGVSGDRKQTTYAFVF